MNSDGIHTGDKRNRPYKVGRPFETEVLNDRSESLVHKFVYCSVKMIMIRQ